MRRTLSFLLLALCLHECLCAGGNISQQRNQLQKALKRLPDELNKPTSKLDQSNTQNFYNSLDDSRKPIFDEMRGGNSAFNVEGKNPREVQNAVKDMSKMSDDVRQMMASGNFSGLTADDMDNMTGSVLGTLKANALDAMNAALNAGERPEVCKKFFMMKMPNIKNLIKKFQCLDAMKDSNITEDASKSQMQALTEVLRGSKSDPGTWTSDEAKMAIRSGNPKRSEIEGLSDSVVNDMINKGEFQKDVGKLRNDVVKALCAKTKKSFVNDDWSQMDRAKVAKLKGLLPKCPNAISQMPASAAVAAASDLGKQAGSMSKVDRRKLAEKLGSANQWSLSEAKERFEFIKDCPKKLKFLSDSNVIGLLDDASTRQSLGEMNDKEARSMKNRIMRTNDFKNAGQMDSSKLQKLPPNMIGKLSPSYLKQVPCSAIAGSISHLKDTKFETQAQKKSVFKRCKTELGVNAGSITKAKIEELGDGMDAFDSDEFDQMPASEIASAKSTLSKIDFSKSRCKVILKKMRENNSGSLSGECGSLGKLRKCMKQSDLAQCGPSDLGLDDTSTTPDLDGLDKASIKKLARSFLESEGGLSGGSSKLSATNFARLAKVLAKGMRKSDIDDLPVDSDLPDKVEAVLGEEDDMDSAVLSKFGQKLKDFVDFSGVSNLDTSTATKIGKAFKHYKKMDEEFETLTPSNDVRQTVCTALGSSKTTVQTQTEKEKQFQRCYRYRPHSTDSTKVVDKSSGGNIESGDIQDSGNLLDGMREADVDRLDQTGVSSEDNIQKLCKANMKFSVKRKLMSKLRQISDVFTDTTKSSQLGGCAGVMTSEDFNKISSSDAEDICEDLLTDNEDEETTAKTREDSGFKDEMTDAEKTEKKDGKGRLAQKCLPAIQANNAATSRRRKRATTTLTCDDLTSLGSGVTGVTAEQIGTLSNAEFEACIENMNQYSGWTSDRRSAFTSKAKSAWGAVSEWTTEQVRLGGSIVASGLTEAEIGTLNLGTSEAATSVGATNYYTTAQLTSLFNRYLTSNSVQTNALVSDQLSSLGNMACGATDTQIASFQNAQYKDAASSFGSLTSCEQAQLVAYGNHAKTAFGAVSTWDTATVSTIGTMIGGIGSDISQLTSDQLGAVSATAISAVPPSTFAQLTTSQLSGLSAAQANSVTSSQQSALNDDQMTALTEAGASTKSSNGATRMTQASVLLVTLAVLFNRL